MYGPYPGAKKGRCREVAVSGGSAVVLGHMALLVYHFNYLRNFFFNYLLLAVMGFVAESKAAISDVHTCLGLPLSCIRKIYQV